MKPPRVAKMTYAVASNDQTVHITEVARGLACACTCAGCGERLVAKLGTSVTHHFAHYAGAECEYGLESALHLAAKDALASAGAMWVPAAPIQFDDESTTWKATEAQLVVFDKIEVEKRAGFIIPDLTAWKQGRQLLIEIKVTHGVDATKLAEVRQRDLSMLEIDLSGLDFDASRAVLNEHVVGQTDRKRWIYNARANQIAKSLVLDALPLPIVARGMAIHVDDCPVAARRYRGRSYANVIGDCSSCKHLLHIDNQEVVLCLGHRGASSVDEWKAAVGGGFVRGKS